ncbi:MAG: c-type cytochrome [Burkholderiaceae bacterium]|nr:c-type cytochrome [Burkholderiaceae bacterium]
MAAPEIQEPIAPLPLTVEQGPAKVALGERLFHDVRLSRDNSLSCATCHQLQRGGDDGLPRSKTANGTSLSRNAPTLFNVAFNASFNWDGSMPSLEVQAEQVLLNPQVMNNTWPELLGKLDADPYYAAAFDALYPEGLSPASVVDALVSYEKSLVTPNARFDRYLRGEPQVLSAEELKGYKLFKDYGCTACHQGRNIGGNLFNKFGVFSDPDAPPGSREEVDLGRFSVTQIDRDREVFRVPSLRNVALTAPYFHDGRARTLKKAVATMARVQLDRRLPPQEIDLIVQFLRTLTGEYRGRPLAMPAQEAAQ